VVWRRRESSGPAPGAPAPTEVGAEIEIVVVHRPRYDDWSLPKGKAETGESGEQTALREVEEETGLRCRLGPELLTVRYETPRGEDKTVRWWAMTVSVAGEHAPDDEVDRVEWVTLAEFDRRSDFDSDRAVVHSLVTSGVLTGPF
jgi:8-oxo-dGTP pyrophosphatase MutT (NUDIX family)